MAKEETADQFPGRDQRLPAEFAELLTPPVQHALNHPLRREIMRRLNESNEARSAAEIVANGLSKTPLTLINYHAGVLESCDLIQRLETEAADENLSRRFASTVTEDVQIIAILGATEPLDRREGGP